MRQYWQRVKELAAALNGDGCTASPDLFYRKCCDEHDIHYRTAQTLDGKPITRAQADNRLFVCMKKAGKTPILGRFIIPLIYWSFVRAFGRRHWNKTRGS